MKYDIAKNEDGPLRRTMKGSGLQNDDTDFNKGNQNISGENADRHPGLAERLGNIETHLAVRYGMASIEIFITPSHIHLSQYPLRRNHYWTGSSLWRITSSNWKEKIHPGLHFPSTNLIAVYVYLSLIRVHV